MGKGGRVGKIRKEGKHSGKEKCKGEMRKREFGQVMKEAGREEGIREEGRYREKEESKGEIKGEEV